MKLVSTIPAIYTDYSKPAFGHTWYRRTKTKPKAAITNPKKPTITTNAKHEPRWVNSYRNDINTAARGAKLPVVPPVVYNPSYASISGLETDKWQIFLSRSPSDSLKVILPTLRPNRVRSTIYSKGLARHEISHTSDSFRATMAYLSNPRAFLKRCARLYTRNLFAFIDRCSSHFNEFPGVLGPNSNQYFNEAAKLVSELHHASPNGIIDRNRLNEKLRQLGPNNPVSFFLHRQTLPISLLADELPVIREHHRTHLQSINLSKLPDIYNELFATISPYKHETNTSYYYSHSGGENRADLRKYNVFERLLLKLRNTGKPDADFEAVVQNKKQRLQWRMDFTKYLAQLHHAFLDRGVEYIIQLPTPENRGAQTVALGLDYHNARLFAKENADSGLKLK